jgi:hypothetical protein
MCDPVTIAFAGVQAFGTISQGRTAKYNADTEAEALEAQAAMARDDAQGQAARIRRDGAQARGQALGAIAASGVKVGEGSTLDAERQVMTDYTQDEYLAILTGERQARGLNTEASNRRRAGRDAMRSSYFSAGTSLLSAGANGMRAGGWRSNGPGFSGTQMPAPVINRDIPRG